MKENGFVIGLLAGTLLVGGGLIALGLGQGKRFAEAEASYSDLKDDVERMAKVRPYPSKENEEAREKEVKAFRGKVEGLQNALQEFRPEALEKVSPSEFQNRVVAKSASVAKLFGEKGMTFPEQFALGFERYKDELANPEATGKLNYQLEAMEWLFTELAEVETYSLKNVKRDAIPSESGKDWLADLGRQPTPLYQSMPIELVFLAEESALNEFVNKVSSSKKYFFGIDMIRISNENLNPPTRGQAGLEEEEAAGEEEEEEAGGAFGAFGGFSFDDADADADAEPDASDNAPAEVEQPRDTGRILGQVLGKEAVYVGLQLRLLLFTEQVKLPEIK